MLDYQHFEIERSGDGNRYDRISDIASHGNGSYDAVDEAPLPGYNYYRLKMVDRDAKFSYSGVQVVKVLNSSSYDFVMYPNPNKGLLVIQPSQSEKPVIVTIFDSQGIVILVKQIKGKTSLPINHLAKGVYMVSLSTNGFIKTGKLVKE